LSKASSYPKMIVSMNGSVGRTTHLIRFEADLGAHFAVWLASSEAEFLRNRFSFVNWDVDELKTHEDKIKSDPSWSTFGVYGFPYAEL
jgi:hypothetical protein